jgi:hypothetical protein
MAMAVLSTIATTSARADHSGGGTPFPLSPKARGAPGSGDTDDTREHAALGGSATGSPGDGAGRGGPGGEHPAAAQATTAKPIHAAGRHLTGHTALTSLIIFLRRGPAAQRFPAGQAPVWK